MKSLENNCIMCYAAYIGTNIKQVTKSFEDGDYLFLQQVTDDEMNGLQSKFTKKYIYYVGAYEGCSCAFASDPIQDLQEDIYDLYDDNDASRLHNSIESVTSLLDLIETLTKSDNLEFYCCWEEDWNEPVESYEEIDIRDVELGFNYFGLEEKRFINFPAQYQ